MKRIDVHTHLVPRLPDAALARAGFTREDGVLRAGETVVRSARLYRPEALAAWLHARDLDRALVSIPPPLYRQHLDPAAGAAWTRSLNDALLDTVAGHEELLPAAYLPFEHPDAALAELHRIEGRPWAAFTAGSGGRSLPLDDPRLSAVWEFIEQSNRPVFLHPAFSLDGRLAPHYLGNLLGNPTETALAGAQLLFGGVLTRFPGLRICLAHGAGSLPALLGRWQRGVETRRPGIDVTGLDVRAAARRLYADALTYDPRATDLVIAAVGADHVLLGSDWPFPMGEDDPRQAVAHRAATLVERAATENAAAFLYGAPW